MNIATRLLVYTIQYAGVLLAMLFLLRFLLQLARASFHNPISQFVYRATRIPVDGLTRLLPAVGRFSVCLLYTSPSPRDKRQSRMPSSA